MCGGRALSLARSVNTLAGGAGAGAALQGWTLRATLPRLQGQSVEAWAGKAEWGNGASGGSESGARSPLVPAALWSVPRRPLHSGRPRPQWHRGSGNLLLPFFAALFAPLGFENRSDFLRKEREIIGEDADVWPLAVGPSGFSCKTRMKELWVGGRHREACGLARAPPRTARKGAGLCGRGQGAPVVVTGPICTGDAGF